MNALAVKGLCKRYPDFSLENVSFSVPEGAVIVRIPLDSDAYGLEIPFRFVF